MYCVLLHIIIFLIMNNISCVRKNDSLFSLSVIITHIPTYYISLCTSLIYVSLSCIIYYMYHFRTESGLLYFVMQPARFLRVFNY